MRWNLALALSVSILLVGYASWTRFISDDKAAPTLIAIEQKTSDEGEYLDVLSDFLEPKASSTTEAIVSAKPVSQSEMLSRQLLSDYIGLASSGQATDGTITALADKYVRAVPLLNQHESVSQFDLRIVSDTKENLQNYADGLKKIHQEYALTITGANSGNIDFKTLNSDLYSFAAIFGKTYTDTATKLKNLPVPSALVKAHLELTNTYLSSGASMTAISKIEEDSATAFAGLIAINKNLGRENALLVEITHILNSYGI